MTRPVRIRLVLIGCAALLGGGALALTTLADRAIDTRLNDELAFVYETHLKTVHEIVDYARAHEVEPGENLQEKLHVAKPPDPRDHARFHSFERHHDAIAGAARELITTLDGAVDPDDGRLGRLIRRFDSEERNLRHIRARFQAAGFLTKVADLMP